MLRKILSAIGLTLATSSSTAAADLYRPYAEPHVNYLYNLLFCDDVSLFKTQGAEKDVGLWGTLLADRPDKAALRNLANDEASEGRVRAIAFNRLRALGEVIPPKRLLGVIVEVPLQKGLDVLAAYTDGSVRYLNQSGKVAIVEGQGTPVERLARELVSISQPLVETIGPWEKQRLPPPKAGNVRITFLVSDGLYFGEGPFAVLQKDAMAGPVLSKATELLQRTVALGTR